MAHAQRAAATAKEENALTTSTGLVVMDLGDDAGAGMENLSMNEQLTPFLRILQKGSPQVDPAMPEYNDDLRLGMIYDTAAQEGYPGKDGVEVVVAARDYFYGMWVPRNSGGGFRGMVRPDDPAVRRLVAQHGRFKKLPHVTDDGEAVDLVETIQLYVLYAQSDLSDLNARRAIISMSSTALPVAQAYLTRHNSWRYRQPDNSSKPAQLWSYRWRFSLIPQQNAQGSWFNWRIDLLPPGAKPMEALVPRIDPLFAAGRAFYDMFRAGTIKADYEEAGKADGDQVPF